MPTDTTIIDRLREIGDRLANGAWAQTCYDAADALTVAYAALAECYRLAGADPDGNEDWRLAQRAVAEVRRLREESDAEIAAAHAARDAAEEKLARLTAHPICLLSDYKAMRDERDEAQAAHTREVLLRAVDKHEINTLRAQLTAALRERDEARAKLDDMEEQRHWDVKDGKFSTR